MLFIDDEYKKHYIRFLNKMESGNFRLSHSWFKNFCHNSGGTPAEFVKYKIDQWTTDDDPTDALLEGRILHTLVLQPEEFKKLYIVQPPDITKPSSPAAKSLVQLLQNGVETVEAYSRCYSTKKKSDKKIADEAKEASEKLQAYIEFIGKIDNRSVIKKDMLVKCWKLREALYANSASRRMLDATPMGSEHREQHIEWNMYGFDFHGYVDARMENGNKWDLKKMANASKNHVDRMIKYQGGGMQATGYKFKDNDYDTKDFYFVAIDNDARITVGKVRKQRYRQSLEAYQYYLDKFKQCITYRDWNSSTEYFADNDEGVFMVG